MVNKVHVQREGICICCLMSAKISKHHTHTINHEFCVETALCGVIILLIVCHVFSSMVLIQVF